MQRAHITEWLEVVPAEPLCNRTKNLYLTRLDVLFRWMMEEGIRPDSPTARIKAAAAIAALPGPDDGEAA